MMRTVLRAVAGVACGLLLAFVLVIAVEGFGAVVHPLPKDFDGTTEQMSRHIERYPAWVLAAVVPMWAVTTLGGAWVARKVGGFYAAAFVGLLLLAGLVFNVTKLPYPAWFKAATLIVIPTATILGVGRPAPRKDKDLGEVV